MLLCHSVANDRVIKSSKVHQRPTSQTDRQTDRRTAYHSISDNKLFVFRTIGAVFFVVPLNLFVGQAGILVRLEVVDHFFDRFRE